MPPFGFSDRLKQYRRSEYDVAAVDAQLRAHHVSEVDAQLHPAFNLTSFLMELIRDEALVGKTQINKVKGPER